MTLQDLRGDNLIIFEAIVGSRAYQLNSPDSDTNIIGVYTIPTNRLICGLVDTTFNQAGLEVETKSTIIHRDEASNVNAVYYELRDYLKLLANGSPEIIETLFLEEDCILCMHEDFKKLIIDVRTTFIIDKLKYSFFRYPFKVLRENKICRALPVKNDIEFFSLLPDSTSSLINFKEYLGLSHGSADAYALCEIPEIPDIFVAYVSYRNESRYIANLPVDPETEYPGVHVDREGNVSTYTREIGSKRESQAPLTFKRLMRFDRIAWEKYQQLTANARKKGIYNNTNIGKNLCYDGKALAHAYRLLRFGIQLLGTKHLHLTFDRPVTYAQIKNNELDFSSIESLFDVLRSETSQLLQDKIYTDLSKKEIADIELTLRARCEFTRATNIST